LQYILSEFTEFFLDDQSQNLTQNRLTLF